MTSSAQGLSADTVVARSHHVADLVPEGVQWSLVRKFGRDTVIGHRVEQGEHERRTYAKLGAIESTALLELLMSLPIGLPVPVSALSYHDQLELRRVPDGVVEFAEGEVVRLAVSPVRVDLAVVRTHRWQTGLELAGRFAPFAARTMWLPCLPSDRDELLYQASRFGVGIMIGLPRRPELVLPPKPFVRRRFTAAGWLFTEQVYSQVSRDR